LKQGLTFLALLALAAAAIWYSLEPRFPVRQGLDLQGGMRVTLEPDDTKPDGKNVPGETIEKVRSVIENRVNSFGLSGTEVRRKGERQILVLLPGAKDPQKALEVLQTVAQLEFRHLNNVVTAQNPDRPFKMTVIPGDATKGETDTYQFSDATTNQKVETEKVLEGTELILKGDALKPTSRAEIDPGKGQPIVTFEFNAEGAQRFASFTTENVNEILAVVLDKRVITAPNINEPITEGTGTISGGFKNMAEGKVLANLLNSGALPVPLRAAETQYVGATLGRESVDQSIRAGLIGLGLVLLFMVGYYWLPGVLACIALIFYTAFTFSIFKGVGIFDPIVLDLPGITGFILSVGMAVDANVLIFERIKEEVRAGRPARQAIDVGFNRAFSSILDSNVTTWIVCGILVWLGAPIIKGFAITLAIGVAVSMFTAITVTRTMLLMLTSMEWARNPALYAPNVGWLYLFFPAARQGGILRVFQNRKIYFGISIATSIIALLFALGTFFGYGLKPGIDFTGGSVVEAAYRDKSVTREQVLGVLTKNGIHDPVVSLGRSEQPWTTVKIEAKSADATTENRLREALGSIRAFDPEAFKATKTGETISADGTFTVPVTQAEIEAALRPLNLKEQKLTVATVPHTGGDAVPVAVITTRQLKPDQLTTLRKDLATIGGGIITPMYQENSIGPSVAGEVTLNAFASVLVASLAIILYLSFRFAIGGFINGLKFGLCAVLALVHDVGIVIGLFALMGALRGWQVDSLFVTACLTVLGFSVHDTIVVYDRIRENLRHRLKGETFADVSDRSITQTFDRSVNTSFTVLLVVAALVFFGGESIRLFNTALLVGIAIGTYSSIFVASPMVVVLERWAATSMPPPPPSGTVRRDETPRVRREPAPVRTASAGDTATDEETPSAEPRTPTGSVRPNPGGIRPRKKRRL